MPTLIAKDSKGKIRVINIVFEKLIDNNTEKYLIHRSSGLKDGKMIIQPDIEILKGKAKRTLEEQCALQFNSEIKKYLDKGYKNIADFGITKLEDLDEKAFLNQDRTDSNGSKKPQLAKSYLDIKTIDWSREWMCSSKLDGVRVLLFMKNGVLRTSSRGGQDYDVVTTYIREDERIIKFFKDHPDIILDGELYIHGKPLNYISGLCRLDTLEDRHKDLKLYCYDIVDENTTFSERYKQLMSFREYNLDKIIFIDHIKMSGKDEIMELHNKFVSNGYEGLVMRDPNQNYKCGARDKRMIKIKAFTDSEFQIEGLSEGMREEDMCFVLKTQEGYLFKAKPMGTREDKQWYREHINEIIGKMGTVKYFGFTNTDEPVPNLPVFRCIRDIKDID